MHSKTGRPINLGDKLLFNDYPLPAVGVVVAASAGCDTCNVTLIVPGAQGCQSATAKDCVHADEALDQSPRPDTESFAGFLYEAYCQAVGGVAWNGDPLPGWQEFRADAAKQKQSDAWVKVAESAL